MTARGEPPRGVPAFRCGGGWCARLHRHLARRRVLTLAATLGVWACCALLALDMRTDNSSTAFFPDDAPEMTRMAEAMDMAPFSRLLFVDISTEKDDQAHRLAAAADAVVAELPADVAGRAGAAPVPDPGHLLALLPSLLDARGLETLRAASAPDAVETAVGEARRTLAGLWGSVAGPWLRTDPLQFRNLVLPLLPARTAVSLPDPELGYPLSKDGRHVLLLLRPRHSIHDVDAAVRLMDLLEKALARHLTPDMRAVVVGGHRHAAANTRAINADVRRIVLLSLIGFAITYLALVRSLGMIWLLLTPLFAVSAAMGGMVLLWPVLSGLALGFGASVLGIAEDYAVHMHFALRSGQGAERVLDLMSVPLFQGLLLNMSGFAVLLFSGIPAVRQLAAFALLSLAAGFLLALIVLPLCPWFDRPTSGPAQPADTAAPGAGRTPATGRVFACGVLLLSACGVLLHLVRVDVAPRTMGADMAAMQADAALLRMVWGTQAGDMLVVQGRTREEALERARWTAAELRRRTPGNTLTTLTDLLPDPATAAANRERWSRFVAEQGDALARDVTEAGRRYGFREDAFAPFVRALRASVRPLTPELLRDAGLGEFVDTFLREEPEKVQALILGQGALDPAILPPELREHVAELSPETLESTLLALLDRETLLLPAVWIVCCLLLYACFRNMRQTLLAALPPLCSLCSILGWMVWTGTPLTLAALAALPLVMGLAADHGILVTHDLAHGMELGIHRAVLVSSLTALTGMGLLALAEHPALRAMGQVIFFGLLVEVPAALWLLPRLCRRDDVSPLR